ncbi:MAG: hypothetical protein ABIB55_00955 [Candidatus Nealsonbacteria bacterium]
MTINLEKIRQKIEIPVKNPSSGEIKIHQIEFRINPAFGSRARIAPSRVLRKKEVTPVGLAKNDKECFFCHPEEKCARFPGQLGLKEQYFNGNSAAFSNLYPFGQTHGVVVYNCKRHQTGPQQLEFQDWLSGLELVQAVGRGAKKEYVSTHFNCGQKAAASLEHFHGQFHCEDFPLAKTKLLLNSVPKGKSYWPAWLGQMEKEGLLLDFDKKNQVAFYVEWAPAFGKTELVVITLKKSSFQLLDSGELNSVAKYLEKATRILSDNISRQFNMVNLSAGKKDNFCNQFRLFPRAPVSEGIKSWEGYLESAGEVGPSLDPQDVSGLFKRP